MSGFIHPALDEKGINCTLIMYSPNTSLSDLGNKNSKIFSCVSEELDKILKILRPEVVGIVAQMFSEGRWLSDIYNAQGASVEIKSVEVFDCAAYVPAGFLEREVCRIIREDFSDIAELKFQNNHPSNYTDAYDLSVKVMGVKNSVSRNVFVEITKQMFEGEVCLKGLSHSNFAIYRELSSKIKLYLGELRSKLAGMVAELELTGDLSKSRIFSVCIDSVIFSEGDNYAYIPAGFIEKELRECLEETFLAYAELDISNDNPVDFKKSRKLFVKVLKIKNKNKI